MLKLCKDCSTEKPISEFNKNGGRVCKKCHATRQRAYYRRVRQDPERVEKMRLDNARKYQRDKEVIAERARTRYAGDPEYRSRVRDSAQKYRAANADAIGIAQGHPGIGIDDVRAALEIKPDRCEICSRKRKLVFDQNPHTRTFRGWLCYSCNSGLHVADYYLDEMLSYLRAKQR